MMKPRFYGTVTDWHQDSVAWPMFAPQNHVSCWVALDDATVDNGCMTVIPGSHKWGPIAPDYKPRFLSLPHLADPVPVELKAGHCMFHHGLNFPSHRSQHNPQPAAAASPSTTSMPRPATWASSTTPTANRSKAHRAKATHLSCTFAARSLRGEYNCAASGHWPVNQRISYPIPHPGKVNDVQYPSPPQPSVVPVWRSPGLDLAQGIGGP